jgi:hypothetical protein
LIARGPSVSGGRILAGCALVALLLGGCSRMSILPLHQELEHPGHAWQSAEGRSITGFITNDGAYHRFQGWVKVEGDSLLFHGPPRKNEYGEASHRMATTEVTTLLGKEFDTARVAGVSAAVLLNVAVVLGALWLLASVIAGGGS